jgi:lipopolysaccharide/colanic/teichoic acid biosynthesis glycosyltransferase
VGVKEIVLGVLLGVIATEIVSWSPRLAKMLVWVAVKRLPAEMRKRMSEEWLGHLKDTPGALGKLYVALDLVRAAFIIAYNHRHPSIPIYTSAAVRSFDIFFSVYLVITLLPLYLMLWAVIHMSCSGPALLKDTKIGRGQRLIHLYRFRTTSGKTDAHFTRIGRIVVALGMDDLPRLLNLLKGDLTLVGPRAYRPCDLPALGDRRAVIFSVRPGIGFGRHGCLMFDNDVDNDIIANGVEVDTHIARQWSLSFVTRRLTGDKLFLFLLASPLLGIILSVSLFLILSWIFT